MHSCLPQWLMWAQVVPKKIFEIRAAELKTVKRKFKDMLAGTPDAARAGAAVHGVGPGTGGAGGRWGSRRVRDDDSESDDEPDPAAAAAAALAAHAAKNNSRAERMVARAVTHPMRT
jgi:hypothetical protein